MEGNHVLFNGKEYIIIHKYTSDYCEIKEVHNPFNIELVHISEIKIMQLKKIVSKKKM